MNIKRIIQEEIDDWDWVRDTTPPLSVGHIFYFPTFNSDGSTRSLIIVTDIKTESRYNPNNFEAVEHKVVYYKQESGMGTLQMRTGRASEEKFQEMLDNIGAVPSPINNDIYGKHEE